MRSSTLILGAVLLSAVIITGTYFFVAHKNKEVVPEETLQVAPDFSIPNADGGEVSLEDVPGKVKIINFWASWSPYSKEELQILNKVKREFKDDVGILALCRDHYPYEGQEFLRQHNIGNDILYVYDKEDDYFKVMSGFAVPETLFLNEEGGIVLHKHGPMTYDEIVAQIESMLK